MVLHSPKHRMLPSHESQCTAARGLGLVTVVVDAWRLLAPPSPPPPSFFCFDGTTSSPCWPCTVRRSVTSAPILSRPCSCGSSALTAASSFATRASMTDAVSTSTRPQHARSAPPTTASTSCGHLPPSFARGPRCDRPIIGGVKGARQHVSTSAELEGAIRHQYHQCYQCRRVHFHKPRMCCVTSVKGITDTTTQTEVRPSWHQGTALETAKQPHRAGWVPPADPRRPTRQTRHTD